MTDIQVFEAQTGVHSPYDQAQPFPLEAEVSRMIYGNVCDVSGECRQQGDYAPVQAGQFNPRFSNLLNRSHEPYGQGRVLVPSYDMSPRTPCVTGDCNPYEAALANSLHQANLRPEDVIRIILAANSGYVDQSRANAALWNNPRYAMYQAGRVPPSQVPGYDVARSFLDPQYVDSRGMCPSDYPCCPNSMRPNPRDPRMWVTPDANQWNQPYPPTQWNPNVQWNPNQQWNPQQQWNPNVRWNPNQQWNPNQWNDNRQWNQYNNEPRIWDGGCNPHQWNPNNQRRNDYNQNYDPRFDRYDPRFNRYNPGFPGGRNDTLSQVMRYAPFVLSMINRGGRGGFNPGGFNNYNNFNGGWNGYNNGWNGYNNGWNSYPGGCNSGGYMNGLNIGFNGRGGGLPAMLLNGALNGAFDNGGCNSSYNRYNNLNRYNNFNRYNGGGRGGVRIGNFSFRF